MDTVGKPMRDLSARILLDRRLAAYKYPIGWTRFTFNMLRTVSAKHSMELFRKAGTVCVHIFKGMHTSGFHLDIMYFSGFYLDFIFIYVLDPVWIHISIWISSGYYA